MDVMLTANEILQQFIDFFVQKHDHTFVPSSSVVPLDDPTLMFTNAGMNQFKDVFLGTGTRPYRRAVNSQKCIRVSGKHNDLEEVGRDTYHHTFFEMLGNWSFGDYYKAEAIRWAWELLTKEWGIDKSRLHATVFGGDTIEASGVASAPRVLEPDDEAFKLWTQVTDIALRVIADHLRMLVFAITDGALPSNKGRGAVVRGVLRRALRFGYQYLDQREPFIWKLVPAVVTQMRRAYPDLTTNPGRVQDIIKGEEADFLRTIERGLFFFNEAVACAIGVEIARKQGARFVHAGGTDLS